MRATHFFFDQKDIPMEVLLCLLKTPYMYDVKKKGKCWSNGHGWFSMAGLTLFRWAPLQCSCLFVRDYIPYSVFLWYLSSNTETWIDMGCEVPLCWLHGNHQSACNCVHANTCKTECECTVQTKLRLNKLPCRVAWCLHSPFPHMLMSFSHWCFHNHIFIFMLVHITIHQSFSLSHCCVVSGSPGWSK